MSKWKIFQATPRNQKKQTNHNTNNPSNDESHSPDNPPPESALSGGLKHNRSSGTKCEDTKNQDGQVHSGKIAFLSLVAAIGGVFAALASGYQGYVARHTEAVANRAFVISNSIELISYEEPSNQNRTWWISPVIENVGNTPTRKLRFISIVGTCSRGEPQPESLEGSLKDLDVPKEYIHGLIGPKSDINGAMIQFSNVFYDVRLF